MVAPAEPIQELRQRGILQCYYRILVRNPDGIGREELALQAYQGGGPLSRQAIYTNIHLLNQILVRYGWRVQSSGGKPARYYLKQLQGVSK